MKPPRVKIYLVLIIILTLVFLVSIIYQPPKKQQSSSFNFLKTTINYPSPTRFLPSTPSLAPPQFTGGFEEEIPPQLENQTEQIRQLRQKTPLLMDQFILTYNYHEALFIVEVKPPYEENKIFFQNWQQKNYPAIPWNRFIFQ